MSGTLKIGKFSVENNASIARWNSSGKAKIGIGIRQVCSTGQQSACPSMWIYLCSYYHLLRSRGTGHAYHREKQKQTTMTRKPVCVT